MYARCERSLSGWGGSVAARVVVIFLDDAESVEMPQSNKKRFSFRQAQEMLREYRGSLSDAVLEERREAR